MSDLEAYVKSIYFGNPKQGKTTAMAGAARLGKVIAIDTEGEGWLRKPLMDQGIPVENIVKYGPVTSYQDMEQIYWEVKGMFDDADDAGDPELAPFAVCVDHMTDLESTLLTEARQDRLGRVIRPLEKKAATSPEARDALKDINLFKNERDDYGVWTNQAKHLMRLYRDLPCHVAFAAHFRTEGGQRVPSLTEKFRIDLMGSMNMILACTKMAAGDQTAYVAYSTEMDGWYAGDRFNVLKPCIVNPSLDRVIMATQGKIDFDTDPAQVAFKQALSG